MSWWRRWTVRPAGAGGSRPVRRSEFRAFVRDEFGDAYGQVLVHDQVLTELGDETPEQALERGEDPKTIWLALCRHMRVDSSRWAGVPRRR